MSALQASTEVDIRELVATSEAVPTENPLPTVITDYLDLLIQNGTTSTSAESPLVDDLASQSTAGLLLSPLDDDLAICPEQQMDSFRCLRFMAGDFQFLTPFDRIQRIDPIRRRRKYYGRSIPECHGEEKFQLQLHNRDECIYIDEVLDTLEIDNKSVIWRLKEGGTLPERAPWFVGTHIKFLCRIFDPVILLDSACGQGMTI